MIYNSRIAAVSITSNMTKLKKNDSLFKKMKNFMAIYLQFSKVKIVSFAFHQRIMLKNYNSITAKYFL